MKSLYLDKGSKGSYVKEREDVVKEVKEKEAGNEGGASQTAS